MSRWRRTKTVATFEFLTTVSARVSNRHVRHAALYRAVPGSRRPSPAYFMARQASKPSIYGVVDPARILSLKEDATAGSDRIPEALRQALEKAAGRPRWTAIVAGIRTAPGFARMPPRTRRGRPSSPQAIKGYFVLPRDYMQNGGVSRRAERRAGCRTTGRRKCVSDLFARHLLAGRVDGTTAARVLNPVARTRQLAVTPTGEVVDGGGTSSVVRSSCRWRS